MHALNPVQRIGDQLAEAAVIHRLSNQKEAMVRAGDLLERVGLPPRRIRDYPHELSGGQKQRVMIAMALACSPSLIIADEPTTALDVTIQAQILELMADLQERHGTAIVLITHDLGVIAGHVDRVNVMYAGKLVESGTVDDIFYSPRMPYTLGLLGSLPRMDAARASKLTPILGTPPSLVNMPPGCPFAPRCPMAEQRCREEEPELLQVNGGPQAAACHFSDRLVGAKPGDLFQASYVDSDAIEAVAELED
jgi:oligopeptide/dipeptide ABC transporter ATP-binding protein